VPVLDRRTGCGLSGKPLRSASGKWLSSAFPRIPPPAEFQIRDQLLKIFPPGYRVLSDSAYLHAALVDAGVEVVPVWSPEVSFLFTSPPEESERSLRSLRIATVVVYPKTANMAFLSSASPFYAHFPSDGAPWRRSGTLCSSWRRQPLERGRIPNRYLGCGSCLGCFSCRMRSNFLRCSSLSICSTLFLLSLSTVR